MGTKMAGKNGRTTNKATKSPRDERAPFVGYVNITLTEKDKEDFTAWRNDPQLWDEAYLETLASGYQLTLKYDPANDAYSCSISCWDASHEDAGIIYTGRSDLPFGAVEKCIYVLTRKLAWSLSNGYVKHQRTDAFQGFSPTSPHKHPSVCFCFVDVVQN
jgi:hypothetical protein